MPIAGTLSGYLGSKSEAPGETALEVDLVIAGLRSVIPALRGRRATAVRGRARRSGGLRRRLAGAAAAARAALREWSAAARDLGADRTAARERLGGRAVAGPARPRGGRSCGTCSAGCPRSAASRRAGGLERIEAGRARALPAGRIRISRRLAGLPGRTHARAPRALLARGGRGRRPAARRRQRSPEGALGAPRLDGRPPRGDRARARCWRASRCPVLDLSLDGVSNFLAGDPERRRLAPGGEPLRGLGALADVLAGDPEPEPPPLATRIRLEIDALDHPVLLWPIEQLAAVVELAPEGVRVEELSGIWAGVPISGEAVFARAARAHGAGAAGRRSRPSPTPPVAQPAGLGAGSLRGRAPGDPRLEPRARERPLHGAAPPASISRTSRPRSRLPAASSARRASTSRATGSVPYRASFRLEQGDVPGVARRARAAGGFRDRADRPRGLLRGDPRAARSRVSTDLTGLLSVRARDGEIRRVLPAVVAIALASRSFNPFTGREQIRYDRAETVLEFARRQHAHRGLLDRRPRPARLRLGGSLAREPGARGRRARGAVPVPPDRQRDREDPRPEPAAAGHQREPARGLLTISPVPGPIPTRSWCRCARSRPGRRASCWKACRFLVRKGLQAIGAIDGDAGAAPARPFSPEPPPRKDS